MKTKKKKAQLEIKSLLKKIEESKNVISYHRDKLRDIFSDLEDVIESCDSGIEGIEDGMRTIESGIDDLSQYL
jgi:predicted  nucleic acid-binding Zn-ribbon protein